MSRLYAGILGLLAFLTTLIRGMLHGGLPESILWTALGNLLVFTLIGGIIGWIAGRLVEEMAGNRNAAGWNGPRIPGTLDSDTHRILGG